MITFSHVSKTFDGETYVVNDVSFEVKQGETLVLLGASGCGKTTLLKMINRLIEPTSGEVRVDTQAIKTLSDVALRRSIGYVFQKVGLFPHMTVQENISIVLRLMKKRWAAQVSRARELLELVNLDPDVYATRFPGELSGGQQQRVGVARALANDPDVLLMDEPFGAVDAINRDALQLELAALKLRLKKTIIFVTHDIFEAIRLGDRIAVMNKGCIEQIGTSNEIIKSPQTPYVRELIQTHQDQVRAFLGDAL